MRALRVSLAAIATFASLLMAQGKKIPELRPFAGVLIPTGDQHDLFKDGWLTGIEVAAELEPALHVIGTFAWSSAEDRFGFSNARVYTYEVNVGMEIGVSRRLSETWLFKPFFGLGGGARTYAYADPGIMDDTCGELYASGGTEMQVANTAFRLEARDNLFCFRSPLHNTQSDRRNDIGVILGIAYHFR